MSAKIVDKPPAPRRWLRRAVIFALILVALRLVLAVGLSPALRAGARTAGFDLALADLDLDLTDGALELRGLELRVTGSADEPPLLRLDQLRFDADLSALFGGDLHVHRLEVDGLVVELRRDAEGRWNLPEPAATRSETDPQAAEPADAGSEDVLDPNKAPFPLRLPVVVDALMAQGVVLRVHDEFEGETIDRELRLNLRATAVGDPEQPTSIALHGHGPGWLDLLRLDAKAERGASGDTVADGTLALAGLHPAQLARLMALAGIEPLVEQIDAEAHLSLSLEPLGDGPDGPLALSAALEGLRVRADLEPEVEVELLSFVCPSWSQAALEQPTLTLRGASARAARDARGRMVVCGLALGAGATEAAPTTPEPSTEGGSAPPPALVDAAVAIEDVTLAWRDEAAGGDRPVDLGIVLRRFGLRGLHLPLGPEAEALELELLVEAREGQGQATATGDLVPRPDGFDLRLELGGEGLDLVAVEPYLTAAGLSSTLESGYGALTLTAAVDWQGDDTIVAAQMEGARFADGERPLFQWRSATLEELTLPADGPAHLGQLSVSDLSLPFERRPDGGWTVAGIVAPGAMETQVLRSSLRLDRLTVGDRIDGPRRTLVIDVSGGVDGVVSQLGAKGQARLEGGATGLSFDLEAAGVDSRILGPLLAESGLTCELDGAGAVAHVELDLDAQGRAQGSVTGLRFGRDEQTYLGLDRLEFGQLDFTGDVPHIGAIALQGPRLTVRRDAAGAVHALGLRFAPPAAVGSAAATATGGDGTASASSADSDSAVAIEQTPAVATVPAGVASPAPGSTSAPSTALPTSVVAASSQSQSSQSSAPSSAPKSAPSSSLASSPSSTPSSSSSTATSPAAAAQASPAGEASATTTEAATRATATPGGAFDSVPIPTLKFDGLKVEGGALTWVDEFVGGAPGELSFEATVAPFTSGPGGSALEARLSAAAPGLLTGIELALDAELDPTDTRVQLDLQGRGLDSTGIGLYLPPGVETLQSHYDLDLQAQAGITSADDGGLALRAELILFELRGDDDAPLAGSRSASLVASRVDPAAGVYLFDELVVGGVDIDIATDLDGATEVAGIRLATAPTEVAATGGGVEVAAQPASPPAADAVAREIGTVFPTVRLERLDLNLGQVTYRGAALGEGAEPLVVTGSVRSPGALELCGPIPEDLPPIQLEARLQVDQAEVAIDTSLEPFNVSPGVEAQLRVTGIRGERLRALAPALAERIDTELLGEGRLTAQLSGELDLRRASVLSFDLSDGFAGELTLDDLDWRDTVADQRFLGLDALRVELKRVQPSAGLVHVGLIEVVKPFVRAELAPEYLELLGLRFKTPEAPDLAELEQAAEAAESEASETDNAEAAVASDQGVADQGADRRVADGQSTAQQDSTEQTAPERQAGEQVAGAQTGDDRSAAEQGAVAEVDAQETVRAPSDETVAAADAAQDSATRDSGAQNSEAEAKPAAVKPPFELRIDQLLLTGLDAELLDSTVDPPAVIPLRSLDVEVDQFTTLALTEPRPIRFSAYLGCGEVELPAPVRSRGGVLGGLASGLASVVTGNKEERRTEMRPLFQEVGASGQITLAPVPTGWARMNIVGFELLGLRGWARRSGIEIGAGVLDFRTRLRFTDDGRVRTDSKVVFDDLSLSEPAGGPISKWLKLPAPLDSVIFLLRDDSGEISLPLNFTVEDDGISTSVLAAKATATLARVIADAVASAPLRVTGTLTGMLGLGGSEPDREPVVREVTFPAGLTILGAEAQATLDEVAKLMRDDDKLELTVEHFLGQHDIARTDALVNPDPATCLELADRVSRRLELLEADRAVLAAEARVRLLIDSGNAAVEAAAALRLVETRIGRAERALDDLYGRLRPGDERRRPRRVRAGALELADLRQTTVLEHLLVLDGSLEERVDLRSPRLDTDAAPEIGRTVLTLRRRR
ncbi:DUF748 domain-containing protein [Engelhardtia mirabilis]|uniref:AsmA family protein n=1 Tax=Engelhardtia mirabilis TaxID=2528011 RepID=A0A518BEU7_9BACT|nr:hypothetical protein Pla133_05720 [Planctomycetes bacterium Pla133]QDU99833.1 hypothetical protein Pla86_05720 [Planctomycetes bacterium Pla86]